MEDRMLFVFLAACGSGSEAQEGTHAAPEPHQEDAHASHGAHMAEMAKTRDQLRATLGEAYDAPIPGFEAADPAKGKAMYDQACASCHGPAGKGDGPAGAGLNPPAADFTDAFHARYYSDAARLHIIQKGLPGTAMTGFEAQFDQAQLLDLYAYVRQFREAPHDHGAHEHEPGAHEHGDHKH
jgi:mono/diheme cytochrome c family protein